MPDYSEMLKNTSLVFFCSHAASEGSIRPNVPAAIEIGGKQKNNSGSRLISILQMSGQMDSMLRKMADALKDERVKDLYLNKGNHFDLVISGYFMNDYQLGFARKVNAPVIVLAPSPPGQMLNSLIGNPNDPIEKDKNTSFAQRLDSFITNLFYQVFVLQIDQRNRRFYK